LEILRKISVKLLIEVHGIVGLIYRVHQEPVNQHWKGCSDCGDVEKEGVLGWGWPDFISKKT
jgi:hypothetical protein